VCVWDVSDGLCLASMPRMLEEYAPTSMVRAKLSLASTNDPSASMLNTVW